MLESVSLAEIEQEFTKRVQSVIWCNVATVDTSNRPRSRVAHPLWEGMTGWMTTRRQSPKSKHLAANPYVSLAYIADLANPLYIDCTAEWMDDPNEKLRVWNWIKDTPAPVGFDPAPIYKQVDDPGFGLLKLTPWRIQVDTLPHRRQVWYATPAAHGAEYITERED